MKKSLKQRLNELHEKHGSITFKWDGGNDSGSYYLYIGDEQVDWEDDLLIEVADLMDGALGYGSFAGDFYCEGELTYDPEEGAFIGQGKDHNDDYGSVRLDDPIEIKIPEDLWFDSISIDASGDFNDDFGVNVRMVVNNGPVVEEHSDVESILGDYIGSVIKDSVVNHDAYAHSCYTDWVFRRDQFITNEDGSIVAYIYTVIYSARNTEHNSYHVNIPEDEE